VALFWVPDVDGEMSESGFMWGDYVSWKTRADAAERRVAELERKLLEAESVLRIYADFGGDTALEYFGETPK